MTLGEKVNLAKGKRSIRRMAKDTGVTASYITAILKGKYKPSINVLRKLATKAENGITLQDFIDDTEITKTKTLCDIKTQEVDAIMGAILKNLAGIDGEAFKEILLVYRDYEEKAKQDTN